MAEKKIIIVESQKDIQFIKDLLEYLYIKKSEQFNENNFEFKEIGSNVFYNEQGSGKNKLEGFLRQSRNFLKDTFIIVDADKKEDTKKYKNKIDKILKKIGIDEQSKRENFLRENVFFLPNNKEEGNLENLIIPLFKFENFNQCFDDFKSCVQKFDADISNSFNNKLKVYNYNYKSSQRYLSDRYNLKHDILTPLKNFLQKI